GRILAGYGFRTSKELLNEVEEIVRVPLVRLELKNPLFYHLDTCLVVINSKSALYVREAFTPDGLKTLQESFSDLIEVDAHEASDLFACNSHSPDGKNIIIQRGCEKTIKELKHRSLNVIEVDTSEFIKSGG